jgi:hypothetical protein
MNTALRERLRQFPRSFQLALVPLVEADLQQPLTPMMERLFRIWEFMEVERFVPSTRGSVDRPPRDRAALARAFVAKSVLGLTQRPTLSSVSTRTQRCAGCADLTCAAAAA